MAKKKNGGGKRKMTIPMAVAVPTGLVILDVAQRIVRNPSGAKAEVPYILTGYSPGTGWDYARFAQTWGPIVAGAAVHWGANRFGINRVLANAKIPIIRV